MVTHSVRAGIALSGTVPGSEEGAERNGGKVDQKDVEVLGVCAGEFGFHSVDVKHGDCKHWVWNWTA